MNREDFEILNQNLIYFDNGATTLKPRILGETISEYYNEYSANAHRGDYDISLKVDAMYENTRDLVRDFLHAKDRKEIIFTSGATASLNQIVFGFFRFYLKEDDEVLLTKSEHASNLLPWFEIGANVSYIPLDEHYKVTLQAVKDAITPHTKVISIAHISNVIGDERDIASIIAYAHQKNILVVIDGAQSVPHQKIDVQALDIDFLAFSAHKMCGPTGVGVLYAKKDLLAQMKPMNYGGGMNVSFKTDGTRIYQEPPTLFEAGTPNIAGVIGFGKIIEYLTSIGMDTIQKHERMLKQYCLEQMKTIPNIIVYNEESESGILTFNMKDIFSQDLAIYLNKYNICVRAGSHCAKILNDELKIKNTCRISFYFYNTKEEIDQLIKALKNPNIQREILI